MWFSYVRGSAWCFKNPIHFRNQYMTTLLMALAFTALPETRMNLTTLSIQALEVHDRLDASGTSLSGGQQQRLCIARTIAIEPEVILMDEPCSALDPIATAIIEELIEELKNRYAIVIVTHSMQQAARISQKTAFFHLGRLMARQRRRWSSEISHLQILSEKMINRLIRWK